MQEAAAEADEGFRELMWDEVMKGEKMCPTRLVVEEK
jgi:hypothetical protein